MTKPNEPAYRHPVTTPNDGGPAFPVKREVKVNGQRLPDEELNWLWNDGMTLRDYFAGQAIGVIVDNLMTRKFMGENEMTPFATDPCDTYAQCAYHVADAMIAAREQTDD